MKRTVLTDAQWAKMEPLCLGTVTDIGRSGKDDRLFIEAVLWMARMRFELMPGQNYDTVDVLPLIQDVAFGGLTADKAFDIHAILDELDRRGTAAVIFSARTASPNARST